MVRERNADLRSDGLLLTARRHFVIFNPASGRGQGRRRIQLFRQLLEESLDDVTFAVTTRPGEERDLAEQAIDGGYDVIVAMGGDGTWSNVADRLVASGRKDVALGILPSGTGNDFGRNFGDLLKHPAEAVRVLAEGHTRAIDVGRLETGSAAEREPARVEPRHFLNLIGFGFDVAVIDATAGARFLRGELLYKVTALQQLFRFPGIRAEVLAHGGERRESMHLMLTVSNGRFFGGGFPIAPDATVSDGKLHACLIGDAPPLTRLKLFNLAERGRHTTSERVEILEDTGFRLLFAEPPRFEMDGELRQAEAATLDVHILPGALHIVTPREGPSGTASTQ